MKVKSGQIYTEKYIYTLDTTVQQFWFSKGRPEGVLELVWLSIYNSSGDGITSGYILMKRKGEVIRIDNPGALAAKAVDIKNWPVYLEDGDELGVEMDGSVVGILVEVSAQWIYHADKEW